MGPPGCKRFWPWLLLLLLLLLLVLLLLVVLLLVLLLFVVGGIWFELESSAVEDDADAFEA